MRLICIPQRRLVFWGFGLVVAAVIGSIWVSLPPGESPQSAVAIYRGNESADKIALTFNVDWGEDYLDDLIDILSRNGVRATFFLTGRWADKNPRLVGELVRADQEIGNHGYSHPHPDQLGKEKNKQEILEAESILVRLSGKKPDLFAPPYGEHSVTVVESAEELGYQTILWTIDTIDWQEGRSAQAILKKVVSSAKSGAIVLMHPTRVTLEVLPSIIERLQKIGFQLVTVSKVLQD